MLVVPYITDMQMIDEVQLDQLQVGSSFLLRNDVRMKMETVTDNENRQWLGVFTSPEEMHKESSGNVQMSMEIRQYTSGSTVWQCQPRIIWWYWQQSLVYRWMR